MNVKTAAKKCCVYFDYLFRKLLFIVLEYVVPVRENHWCFCTWQGEYAHTIDNPRAVYEEVKYDKKIVKIILRKKGQIPVTTLVEGVNVIAVYADSIKGIFYLAVSKVVITGYGLGGISSFSASLTKKHCIVQLWHGIPLKRIGKLFPPETYWNHETHKYSAAVCSSRQDQTFMAAAFSPLKVDRVWLTGLPRNDIILKSESELPLDYKQQLQRLKMALKGGRLVLYAPTWRDNESGVYSFTEDQVLRLSQLLEKHNAMFAIRTHANKRQFCAKGVLPESIFFVNDYPDVNVILRMAEILVTDYSSIYIDFLITGRPILNFTYDMDSYVSERGFLYPLEDAFVEDCFKTFEELISRLDLHLADRCQGTIRYENVKRRFHESSGSPSKKVCERITYLSRN